jgi:hypothetical protein
MIRITFVILGSGFGAGVLAKLWSDVELAGGAVADVDAGALVALAVVGALLPLGLDDEQLAAMNTTAANTIPAVIRTWPFITCVSPLLF